MTVLYVKKYNLDYQGKRYKAGDFVQMEDVEAKKLASSAPDEFEIINKEDIMDINPKIVDENELKEIAKEASEVNSEEIIEDDSTELPSVDPTSAIIKGKK
ncbi:hypothetical protein [Megamonas sp.]|uniref:hypothetical protein n=1 Tax=Megamonas TaxID=158846 RepID=UPI0025847AB8|nr:hypothetical protein [Megamonas sp.]MBD9295464.1 hypothetical protein [Megamonas funiformis]